MLYVPLATVWLNLSNLAYRMLLAQEQICTKNLAFYVPIGCVRIARYCGKMCSRHLFPYGLDYGLHLPTINACRVQIPVQLWSTC